MLRSLRFRVPALFLIGIVLSGVVAAATAVVFFQNYVQNRARTELRQNAIGLSHLYVQQAIASLEQDRPPLRLSATDLEAASGNRIYYVGQRIFLEDNPGLRRLPDRFLP